MASLIEVDTGRSGYRQVLDTILTKGRWRSPRGLDTIDMGHTTIVMYPQDALPIGIGRNLNPAVAAVEALQLISGTMDAPLLTRIAPNFKMFQEDDGTFHGAYGVRTRGQFAAAIAKLRKDPDSRQAVVTIWNPLRDNMYPTPRDVPCTIALGFAIVDDQLDMHVTMRSNDAWLGLPYDMFTFTQAQLSVAKALGIDVGMYRHTAWSLHLYDRDVDKTTGVTSRPAFTVDLPEGVGERNLEWNIIENIALLLLRGAVNDDYINSSERWYRDQLAPHLG